MATLTGEDLARFSDIAMKIFNDLFARRPGTSGLYRDRMQLLALCQDGALHFVDGQNGVKDIDVWGFFGPRADQPFPFRSRWTADFGPSHLFRHPDEIGYVGRRVDVLGRSIDVLRGETGVEAVRRYLRTQPTSSAWYLARKPVVALWPEHVRGQVIWPSDETLDGT